jgi:predicted nucleic acid-binding protein
LRRVVLDASVVLKWFSPHDEPGNAEAAFWREEFTRGEVDVLVPYLLAFEVLNVAGRRWRWPEPELADLAVVLRDLPWRVEAPSLPEVAHWVGRGLTAYDAAYVAVAVAASCSVVTADEEMLATAPSHTTPLVPC